MSIRPVFDPDQEWLQNLRPGDDVGIIRGPDCIEIGQVSSYGHDGRVYVYKFGWFRKSTGRSEYTKKLPVPYLCRPTAWVRLKYEIQQTQAKLKDLDPSTCFQAQREALQTYTEGLLRLESQVRVLSEYTAGSGTSPDQL